MKNIVVVESPSKAKTIQKYLGSEFKVLASNGHVIDLPHKKLGVIISENFNPQYEIIDAKSKKFLTDLKKLSTSSNKIIIATDPDREGEAIGWHIAEYLGLKEDTNRITFDEISRKAVNKALQSPKKINLDLVNAQQARRIIDRLVGYKISPILNKKIRSNLSAGRVQSAVLAMIVDREKQIESFIPEEYWTIKAIIKNSENESIKAIYHGANNKKVNVKNESETNEIEKACLKSKWVADTVKKSLKYKKPFPPFTTSTLQQDASNKLNMSSSISMRVAQQLYEGFEIEGLGHIALVTYIRSDSVRVSPDFQASTLEYIEKTYGKEYVPSKPNFYKSKKDSQDAHEAIRPIFLDIKPEDLKNKITSQQYRLYKLIYERYLASQMAQAAFDSLQADILAISEDITHTFKVTGETIRFPGFLIVYNVVESNDDADKEDIGNLPNIKSNENFSLEKIEKEQKFTKPIPRYTEASLIRAMEDSGIGRPSTYAATISVLLRRMYVEKERKSLVPTQLANLVIDFMKEHFEDIVDTSFTAKIEEKLDEIEHGLAWQEVLKNFYPKFQADVENALDAKKIVIEHKESDSLCPKCGTKLIYREGRYGTFLACPNYPQCTHTENIIKVVAPCPICDGEVIERYTRKGKIFYGCNKYPDCKFTSWTKPAPIPCPMCNSLMTVKQVKDGETYICSKKTCNYRVFSTKKE